MSNSIEQGWGFPGRARKAHYFEEDELISLCRKWMYSGERFDEKHDHPENCVQCMKKRQSK